MTATRLNTDSNVLLRDAIAVCVTAGYPCDRSTSSIHAYFAAVRRGLVGGSLTNRDLTFGQILADVSVALGGEGNHLTTSEIAMLEQIVNSSGAGGTDALLLEDGSGKWLWEDGSAILWG